MKNYLLFFYFYEEKDMANNLNALAYSATTSLEAQKKVVREVFISTKEEVKVGNALDKVLEEELWIKGVKTNVLVRYLVDGVTDGEYKTALPTIFWELPVEDLISKDEFE